MASKTASHLTFYFCCLNNYLERNAFSYKAEVADQAELEPLSGKEISNVNVASGSKAEPLPDPSTSPPLL